MDHLLERLLAESVSLKLVADREVERAQSTLQIIQDTTNSFLLRLKSCMHIQINHTNYEAQVRFRVRVLVPVRYNGTTVQQFLKN